MASTSSTANAIATKQLIIAAKVERAIEYKPRGTVGPVVKVLKLIKAVVTVAEDVVRVVETVGAELEEAVDLIGAHERMSNLGNPPEKKSNAEQSFQHGNINSSRKRRKSEA